MIGSLQALEALKLLSGAAPPITDAFFDVDLATLRASCGCLSRAARLPRLRGSL